MGCDTERFETYCGSENTYEPIKTSDSLSTAKTNGTVVAKFVPAQTLSVKCQKWAGTTEDTENVLSDGTIKCVGNTSNISDKAEMDVYINLKFKRTETSDAPAKNEFYTF